MTVVKKDCDKRNTVFKGLVADNFPKLITKSKPEA